MSIAAIAGILAQTPAGGLNGGSHAKRGLMIAAAMTVTAACLLLPLPHARYRAFQHQPGAIATATGVGGALSNAVALAPQGG